MAEVFNMDGKISDEQLLRSNAESLLVGNI